MKRYIQFTLLLLVPVLLQLQSVKAQFYNGSNMTFGKNRIQYNDERIWSQFRFSEFDFLFYQDGRKLTINAAKYTSGALNEISGKLGYRPESKIHFIVFNNLSELKSSNIGLDNEVLYNTGGVTQVIDNKVFLYFDGNYLHLEQQIREGIARVIVMQMLYGEEIGANVKNSTLISLPEWYINGLVSYLSHDWSTENDEKLRNGILLRNFSKFNFLEGSDATLAGHSIWKYVVDRYGINMVPNILYMTKVSRSVENGFLFVLGISFKNLIREWYQYHENLYQTDVSSRVPVPVSNVPFKIRKKPTYFQVKLSPDERYLTFATDKINKKKLFIYDFQSKKKKKLFRLGTKMDDTPDLSFPITAWHPTSGLFAWEVEKKGRRALYLYNLEDKSREEIYLDNINKILDMSYSPNGSYMVISAVVNGYSDIFLFFPGSKSLTRVTYDIYDDLQPRFIDNGRLIAFASNRVSDTLRQEIDTYLTDYSDTVVKQQSFDLFAYDVETKSPILRRITQTPVASESSPMPGQDGHFTFLSDENGITNSYMAYFDSAIAYVDTSVHYRYFTVYHQITDYSSCIRENETYHNANKGVTLFTVGNKSRIVISELSGNPISGNQTTISSPPTPWALERNQRFSMQSMKSDTSTKTIQSGRQGFITQPSDSAGVNIHNYKFTTNGSASNKSSSSKSSVSDTAVKKFVLPHQQNYDVEYALDKLVTQLDFSFLNASYQPYAGFGPILTNAGNTALMKIGVSDLLEDKRIVGGMRLGFSLNNNEYLISYEDMTKRLDRQIVFHRMSYESSDITESSLIKHHLHDLGYILKWPFSPTLAARGTLIAKYDNQVFKSTDDFSLSQPDINSYWAGIKGELIFDNTRSPMTNILYGLRYKVFAEYYQGINNRKLNLITAGFDFRHYSKIHRTLIWANRLAFGTSFGSTRLLYFLGGTDNTLFPSFNTDQPVDTTMNFSFQALATNLRGFPQNIRNGNTFAVINSEIRMPVFRYLMNRPIKSVFLNNFQVVAFGDIGSAWLGLNPYSEQNVMVPRTFYQKPIFVTIKVPRNPLVGGIGAGLRTTILGYFVRFDVAWGIEEMKVSRPRYVLSFSLDF